jgi:hypothetical protein
VIVYNYGKKPIFINVGIIANPNGGPGSGETTLYLPPDANGGIDLACFGILTKEEFETGFQPVEKE